MVKGMVWITCLMKDGGWKMDGCTKLFGLNQAKARYTHIVMSFVARIMCSVEHRFGIVVGYGTFSTMLASSIDNSAFLSVIASKNQS